MQYIRGDIFRFNKEGKYIVITTNGSLNKKEECIMGKGLALQAKRKFSTLPKDLGGLIKLNGNRVYISPKRRLITFPTKHEWSQPSDLLLIERSLKQLVYIKSNFIPNEIVYISQLGCGNGKLLWKDIKPLMEKYLEGKGFVFVDMVEDNFEPVSTSYTEALERLKNLKI